MIIAENLKIKKILSNLNMVRANRKEISKQNIIFNRFNWDLRREPFKGVIKIFVYGVITLVLSSGNYKIRMNIGNKVQQNIFTEPDQILILKPQNI